MDTTTRAGVRAGNPEVFGQLFDTHAQAVYNHGFRLTGNWSTAEEVVSLTFLEAWRLRTRVEPEGGSLRPWLMGIATNMARNTTRAARRYRTGTARLPAAEAVPDFADELVSRIHDADQLAAVRASLDRLRRDEREALVLCVWSGLDYTAAAEALGIPVGTLGSRISRARRKLQKFTEEKREGIFRRGQSNSDRATAVRPVPGEKP